eukprot:13130866-Alexandrium_andersonii.AAC.1
MLLCGVRAVHCTDDVLIRIVAGEVLEDLVGVSPHGCLQGVHAPGGAPDDAAPEGAVVALAEDLRGSLARERDVTARGWHEDPARELREGVLE